MRLMCNEGRVMLSAASFTFQIVSPRYGTFSVIAPTKYRDEIGRRAWRVSRRATKAKGAYRFYVRADERSPAGKRACLYLHRLIARLEGWPAGREVDHRDGQPLNNALSNLRPATHRENSCNQRRRSDNVTGAIGVSWYRRRGKWEAYVTINGRRRRIGYFADLKQAIAARDAAAAESYGRFAALNAALKCAGLTPRLAPLVAEPPTETVSAIAACIVSAYERFRAGPVDTDEVTVNERIWS